MKHRRIVALVALLAGPAGVLACSDDVGNTQPDAGPRDASFESGPFVPDGSTSRDASDGATESSVADAARDAEAGSVQDASDAASEADAAVGPLVPVIDGVLSPDEYGDHTDGKNRQSITQDKTYSWFMSWDEQYLYVAVRQVSGFDPVVLYLDTDAPAMAQDGGDAGAEEASVTEDAGDASAPGGTFVLLPNYDGVNGTIPIGADFVLYWKTDYDEYRTSAAKDAWSAQEDARKNSFASDRASSYDAQTQTDFREIRIAWTKIRASGRPSAFRWLGYAVKSSQPSAQMPPSNLAGLSDAGQTVAFTHWYDVANAAPLTGTKPFGVATP